MGRPFSRQLRQWPCSDYYVSVWAHKETRRSTIRLLTLWAYGRRDDGTEIPSPCERQMATPIDPNLWLVPEIRTPSRHSRTQHEVKEGPVFLRRAKGACLPSSWHSQVLTKAWKTGHRESIHELMLLWRQSSLSFLSYRTPLTSPRLADFNENPSSQSCVPCRSDSALSSSDVYSRKTAPGVHRRAFRMHSNIADNRFLKKQERCAWHSRKTMYGQNRVVSV